jgi:hypothetical protein
MADPTPPGWELLERLEFDKPSQHHYPVWSGKHKLAGCLEDHEHRPGKCCSKACWCRQEPLRIVGGGSGPGAGGSISHLAHPLCSRVSYHPYLECQACCDEQGPHPIVSCYPKAGKPFDSGATRRDPLPKEEGGKIQ